MEAYAYEPLEAREVVHKGAGDDAHARGYDDGYRAGMSDAHAQLAPATQALASAVESMSHAAGEVADATERRAVELAVLMAEKIVATALEVKPELVLEAVGGALRRISTPDHVTLEVAPEDLELVRSSIDQFSDRLAGLERLEVIGERRIARGGCVLRTTEGEIDGQIGEQLARAAEVLFDDLSSRHALDDG